MAKFIKKSYQSLMERHSSKMLFQFILAIAFTTWIHHLYGGWIYDTLWRMWIPSVTIPFILTLTFYLQFLLLKQNKKYLRIIFILMISVFWILSIGLIEGGYNHVLKNLLYFYKFPEDKLTLMFPPEFGDQSFFEPPSDIFFEGTGIIQLFFGLGVLYYLKKLLTDLNS